MSKKIPEIVKSYLSHDGVVYEITSTDSYFGVNNLSEGRGAVEGERALTHSFLMDTLRKVMGRTLTIIDASVHEKVQNKAMKDLVRNIFSDEMEFAAEMAFDQAIMTKRADESFQALSKEEQDKVLESSVSVEEALGVAPIK